MRGATLLFCLAMLPAIASGVPCSHYVGQNPDMVQAIDLLRSVSGGYRLGNCQVEIHVCDSFAETDKPGSIVGDMLLMDLSGRQSYTQFDFPRELNSATRLVVMNGSRMFHYEFDDWDRHLASDAQSKRIEFVTLPQDNTLIRIEDGSFNQGNPRYQWLICEGQHPLTKGDQL